jgi:hypothetical protein
MKMFRGWIFPQDRIAMHSERKRSYKRYILLAILIYVFLFFFESTWRVRKFENTVKEHLILDKIAIISLGDLFDFDWEEVSVEHINWVIFRFLTMSFKKDANLILRLLPFIGDKSIVFPGYVSHPNDSDYAISNNNPVFRTFTRDDKFLISYVNFYSDERLIYYYVVESMTPESWYFCKQIISLANSKKHGIKMVELTEFPWDKLVIETHSIDGYYGNFLKFYAASGDKLQSFAVPVRFLNVQHNSFDKKFVISSNETIAIDIEATRNESLFLLKTSKTNE